MNESIHDSRPEKMAENVHSKTNPTSFIHRLGKHDFQKLIQSYPDLLQKVEALVMERIESVLMIEEREKHRKPFRYESINQQDGDSRRSTDF